MLERMVRPPSMGDHDQHLPALATCHQLAGTAQMEPTPTLSTTFPCNSRGHGVRFGNTHVSACITLKPECGSGSREAGCLRASAPLSCTAHVQPPSRHLMRDYAAHGRGSGHSSRRTCAMSVRAASGRNGVLRSEGARGLAGLYVCLDLRTARAYIVPSAKIFCW